MSKWRDGERGHASMFEGTRVTTVCARLSPVLTNTDLFQVWDQRSAETGRGGTPCSSLRPEGRRWQGCLLQSPAAVTLPGAPEGTAPMPLSGGGREVAAESEAALFPGLVPRDRCHLTSSHSFTTCLWNHESVPLGALLS